MKKVLKKIVFALLFISSFVAASYAQQRATPLLEIKEVKAECKKVGLKIFQILTVTLDNYSYVNRGTGVEFTITGGNYTTNPLIIKSIDYTYAPVPTDKFDINLTNLTSGISANLSPNVTYSITANFQVVGGNTLTFKPTQGLCPSVIQGPIDPVLFPEGKNCTSEVNLLTNGNFMYGNDGSFQSDLALGCNKCVGGTYCVGNQFSSKCSAWNTAGFDHTLNTSSGSFFLVDGSPNTPSVIWSDSVCVCAGKTYTFSFWVKSIYPAAQQTFDLGMLIDGNNEQTITVAQQTPTWIQYQVSWTSSETKCLPIAIKQLTGGAYRDFGIDDIFFGFCCPCAASPLPEEDCVVSIDTTIVKVLCGNVVDIQSIIEGNPSTIKYTIYDSTGTVIFTTSNTTAFSFTLPGNGVFYGTLEVSCGGGDRLGGDEDEDVFEIINSTPVADFNVNSKCTCVNGVANRNATIEDLSNEAGAITYNYIVTDVAASTANTYTTAQPTLSLDPKKAYKIQLTVTDQKGCTAQTTRDVAAETSCHAKFNWWYSWCDDNCNGTKSLIVNFENQSSFVNCSPVYTWNYGDGSPAATGENPPHTYNVPCLGQSFNVTLTMTSGQLGTAGFCKSVWDTMIVLDRTKVIIGVSDICCDGLVHFYTNAIKGTWNTPGSLNTPKWPSVFKNITKVGNSYFGQKYRQYYKNAGNYYVILTDAETENHNRCPAKEFPFTIQKIECLNRNVKEKGTITVGTVKLGYKFSALAYPFLYRLKSKVWTKNGKKLPEISTDFDGNIYKKANGCFCSPQQASGNSGLKTNRRRAVAFSLTPGRCRIGENKEKANFTVKVNANAQPYTWSQELGHCPSDYSWFIFF